MSASRATLDEIARGVLACHPVHVAARPITKEANAMEILGLAW